MNNISQQLNRLKHAWLSEPGIPENLSAIGHASISREDMADAITAMSLLADLLARDDSRDLYLATESACTVPLKNAYENVTKKRVNGDATTHLLGIITFLQQIQTLLIDAVVQSSQGDVQAAAKPLTEKLELRFEPLEPSARAYNMSLGMAFAKAGHID